MNKEQLRELIRAQDAEREAAEKKELERTAKYSAALVTEQNTARRVVSLFDELGVPREGYSQSRSFSLGADGDSTSRAQTSISIHYKQEIQYQTRRGWFGTEKPDGYVIVATDTIDKVVIYTTLDDGAEIESSAIRPYDGDLTEASSSMMQSHFHDTMKPRTQPQYDPEDPDSVLKHVGNISETVDLVTSLNQADPAPELPAS